MAVQAPTPKTELPRRAYGARELSEMTGISERQIWNGIKDGRIPSVRILGRVLIPASELERLLTPAPSAEGGRHDD